MELVEPTAARASARLRQQRRRHKGGAEARLGSRLAMRARGAQCGAPK